MTKRGSEPERLQLRLSTVVDAETLTVFTMDKETMARMIADLTQDLAQIGEARLVWRSGSRFFTFKLE